MGSAQRNLAITAANLELTLIFKPTMASPITTTSATLEAQAIEVLASMQALEGDETKNPDGQNRVTMSINTDTGIISGSFTLPSTMTIGAAGKMEFLPDAYLID